jgi:purine-binding chemotaxis protein CheW
MMQQDISIQNRIQQIVVFKLGKEEYGLSIGQIKEVVTTPVITRMPQTQSFVRGVANIRGTVIAMLDLEERFGLVTDDGPSARNQYALVIDSPDYKMGVLVKEVPNTLSISESSIEQVFTTDSEAQGSYITGIVKFNDRLIILIDIYKVFNAKESQQILKACI